MYANTILVWARYAASTSSAADLLGLSAAPPTQLGDSFLIFLGGFGDFGAQILIRNCSLCYSLLRGATVLLNDENFIDFERFEVFMKKNKIYKKTSVLLSLYSDKSTVDQDFCGNWQLFWTY